MSRVLKRVPLDFDAPIGETWPGYLSPDRFDEIACPACKNGYSDHAENLMGLWYGNRPFHPASTGSTVLRADTPAVRAFAERNVSRSPEFYGRGESVIVREAQRLADLFNGQMSHHLTQDDVNALVEAGRLMDFTHTWVKGDGWRKIEPPVVPTAAQVNEWSLSGFGHDAINTDVVIRARCERDGFAVVCERCKGHGSTEAYEGQRAEAEAWKATEPPTGEGWQLWQTSSEGGPVSPVFATDAELVTWMFRNGEARSREDARAFITAGWASSGGAIDGKFMTGVDFIAATSRGAA